MYRKISKQLQAYHRKFKERSNTKVTMMYIRRQDNVLRTSLREGERGLVFVGLVCSVEYIRS